MLSKSKLAERNRAQLPVDRELLKANIRVLKDVSKVYREILKYNDEMILYMEKQLEQKNLIPEAFLV